MNFTRSFRNTSIAARVFGVVGLMAFTAASIAWIGLYTTDVYNAKVSNMQAASARAILGEQVNGLINAVVMDSRGIYAATSSKDVDKFSKPLMDNLKRIDRRMSEWAAIVPGSERRLFDPCSLAVQDFIKLRVAIVEAGKTQGAPAASKLGNNDVARANRQAVNDAVVMLAKINAAEVDRTVMELADFHTLMATVVPVATIGSILVVTLLASLLVRYGITGPLAGITLAIKQVADGHLDIAIPASDRTNEIGRMANSLEVFRTQANANRAMTAARLDDQQRAETAQRLALANMAQAIEDTASAAMAEIAARNDGTTAAADNMRSLSERTGTSAREANDAASLALANSQTIASAAEQLAASIAEINREVGCSTDAITRAVAARGEAGGTIQVLTNTVGRIGAVANLISSIAAKTNLLALNATIEAARAGEAGKGFAVVAAEVKQLARQTANSTEEITQQIAEVCSAATCVADAVGRIGATIEEVSEISTAIVTAIEQQSGATAEIARGAGETATVIAEMKRLNAEVSGDAQQGGARATEVLDNARGVGAAVTELKSAMVNAVRDHTSRLKAQAS